MYFNQKIQSTYKVLTKSFAGLTNSFHCFNFFINKKKKGKNTQEQLKKYTEKEVLLGVTPKCC